MSSDADLSSRQQADVMQRRRAFLRPFETAMLSRAGDRSQADLEAERAVCLAADRPPGTSPSEPGPGKQAETSGRDH